MHGPTEDAAGIADFTLWLKPARKETLDSAAAVALGKLSVGSRTYMSRAALRRDHDADPELRSAVAQRCHAAGVTAVEHDWRRLRVRGSRVACERAVAAVRAAPEHSHVAVLGPEPTTPMHSNAKLADGAVHTRPNHSAADVARAYRFPTGLTGAGQTIGVVHLTGAFHATDLASAMASARLAVPHVWGGVAGQRSDDDVELALDTQIIAAVANGATLALYSGTNDARGYAEAIAAAVLDAERAPSVISVSYGVPEAGWPPDAVDVIERLFLAAAACGITVIAASGDSGAPLIAGKPEVDYPASSPFVLACGGTDLRLDRGRRLSEHVWNEGVRSSGGGYSRAFGAVAWAAHHGGDAGRGVPDVAAHASSAHGYSVRLADRTLRVGGTSAAAPLWSALIALINGRSDRACGFITPLLYERQAAALFYDVTIGDNGRYRARAGWDPCTGLGAPHGDALLRYLTGDAEL